MSSEILILLMVGMAGGLLHALDADHILAVSAVALEDRSAKKKILRTALLWASGHGLSLVLLILAAVGFGWVIPDLVSRSAEVLVGAILLAVGASILLHFYRGEIRITRHSHENLPPHTHIHNPGHSRNNDHRPVLVGIVHGVAGSAPMLAVLPLLIKQQFVTVSLYIVLFSVCVGLMMCLFGGLLGRVVRFLDRRTARGLPVLQLVLAVQAMAMGSYWIYAAV
jgi:hypothetical protein